MNDFTQEELQEIADMMRYGRKQGIETTYNLTAQVEDKALAMLDNYCEHEWHPERLGPILMCIRCNKCHKKLKGS